MSNGFTDRTTTRVPAARLIGIHHGPSGYTAPDMRRAPVRIDATQAFARPSRTNNRLHWPDGRVTDLHGIAIPHFVR